MDLFYIRDIRSSVNEYFSPHQEAKCISVLDILVEAIELADLNL